MSEQVEAVWSPPVTDPDQPRTLKFSVPAEHSGHRVNVAFSGTIDGQPDRVAHIRCFTCGVEIPQRSSAQQPPTPEPAEATVAESPERRPVLTAPEIAAALRKSLRSIRPDVSVPVPSASGGSMLVREVVKLAARRVESPVIVIEGAEKSLTDDLVKGASEVTGLPAVRVPPGTEVTKVEPTEATKAYVLSLSDQGPVYLGSRWDAVGLAEVLAGATGVPVFVGPSTASLEDADEDAMRAAGWVRAEQDPSFIGFETGFCSECGRPMVRHLDTGHSWHMYSTDAHGGGEFVAHAATEDPDSDEAEAEGLLERVRDFAIRHGIPVVLLGADDLKAQRRGVVVHARNIDPPQHPWAAPAPGRPG